MARLHKILGINILLLDILGTINIGQTWKSLVWITSLLHLPQKERQLLYLLCVSLFWNGILCSIVGSGARHKHWLCGWHGRPLNTPDWSVLLLSYKHPVPSWDLHEQQQLCRHRTALPLDQRPTLSCSQVSPAGLLQSGPWCRVGSGGAGVDMSCGFGSTSQSSRLAYRKDQFQLPSFHLNFPQIAGPPPRLLSTLSPTLQLRPLHKHSPHQYANTMSADTPPTAASTATSPPPHSRPRYNCKHHQTSIFRQNVKMIAKFIWVPTPSVINGWSLWELS